MTAASQPLVAGSGRLNQRERELTAQVHAMVAITPDTLMVKALPPGTLQRYLNAEISPGSALQQLPFDYRMIGGDVFRAQDVTRLRTPLEFIRALRLDYHDTPFPPNLTALHVLEFRAVEPNKFIVPFGAPSAPDSTAAPRYDSDAVRAAAYSMVDAAVSAGVDPNTYRKQINPWPYTGTGLTADQEFGVPQWWRRYDRLPGDSVVIEYPRDGASIPVAVYRGETLGWERLT